MRRRTWKPWGDHPVVVAILIIVAVTSLAATIWFSLDKSGRDTQNGALTVRVADANGSSLANARVFLFYPEGALSQATDAGGISTFPVNAGSNLRVIVEANGFEPQERQISSREENPITFSLQEREGEQRRFIFRTVDANSESPVPSAEIALFVEGELFREVTDSDGFASFNLSLANDTSLTARFSVDAAGYEIEDQVGTILPQSLQYILLSPSTLSLEVPNIPTPAADNELVEDDRIHESESPELNENLRVVEVGSGMEKTINPNGVGLRVIVLGPNSEPWEGVYVSVHEQVPDAAGNPSRGERVRDGRINTQGQIDFEVDDGTYAVCLDTAPGYGWTQENCVYHVAIESEQQSIVKLQAGLLEIAIVDATGVPWEGVYYAIYTQREDASGNPVTDTRATDGRTDNRGLGAKWLTPGPYTVLIDLRGYNWGNLINNKGQVNIPVQAGETHRLSIKMGRLSIGLRRPDGQPDNGVYVVVYTQQTDVNGEPIRADRVWDTRTNDGGVAAVDLTEGIYALQVGDEVIYDIPIEWGEITETDGESFTIVQQ